MFKNVRLQGSKIVLHLGLKCSKSRRFLGLRPRPRWGSLQRSPDPLVVRGFLPSAIAASRLRRLHFPQFSQDLSPQSYIQIFASAEDTNIFKNFFVGFRVPTIRQHSVIVIFQNSKLCFFRSTLIYIYNCIYIYIYILYIYNWAWPDLVVVKGCHCTWASTS